MKLILQITAGILLAKLITFAVSLWLGAAVLKTAATQLPTLSMPTMENPAQRSTTQKIELPKSTIVARPDCEVIKADGTRVPCP